MESNGSVDGETKTRGLGEWTVTLEGMVRTSTGECDKGEMTRKSLVTLTAWNDRGGC